MSFFLSRTSKPNQQKQRDTCTLLFQKVQQIYICLIKWFLYRNFIIDQLRSTFQLKYYAELLSILSQSVPFLQLQVCDLLRMTYK